MIFELILLVGGGLFLYGDCRNGFPVSKSLLGKGSDVVRRFLRQKEENVTEQIDRLLTEHARAIGLLTVAVVAKVEAGKRTEYFSSHLGDQQRILQALRQNLDLKEMEFDGLKTKAETAKVVAQIMQAKKQLYRLTSNVEAKVGFTIGGQIEQLLLSVEHENLKTDSLLGMVPNNGQQKLLQFRQQTEVRKEIEGIRQRIALPPAPPGAENDNGMDDRYVEIKLESQ